MAEAEVPEAKNPFERLVAITIAIIAVVLAFNENHNDNAKTDAILLSIEASEKTTEAANQWSYFQSKSIKGHAYEIQHLVIPALTEGAAPSEKRDKLVESFGKKVDKYEIEKAEIKKQAESLEAESRTLRHEAKLLVDINQRCDEAALLLQVSVILCSVAILIHFSAFWYLGILVALVGAGISISAFFMPVGTGATAAAEQALSAPAQDSSTPAVPTKPTGH
jgi:hypothetical protein